MSFTWSNLKTQLAAKPRRFGVLALLSGVLAVLVIRSLVGGSQPHSASASLAGGVAEPPASLSQPPAQMAQRLRQSQELWKVLREVRGVPADQAFCFDSAYYMADASRRPSTTVVQVAGETPAPRETVVQQRETRSSQVQEQASKFVLQSTVMGNVPVAVINSEVVRAGDRFQGFRIVTIRARQVVAEKDGVTVTLDMAR